MFPIAIPFAFSVQNHRAVQMQGWASLGLLLLLVLED